jgi:serine/threonine-protein kinase
MADIPARIYRRLCDALLQCECFASEAQLRAIFADSRISAWRDTLEETHSPAARVQATIAHLSKRHNIQGENALVLLLRVLVDQIPVSDARHRALAQLAADLEHALTHLGQYELCGVLGRGQYATVYKARDTQTDQWVALKELHRLLAVDPVFLDKFNVEARVAKRLDHPRLVKVYKQDVVDGRPFMVMELAACSLRGYLDEHGAIDESLALRIIFQVAEGLDYLHAQHLVHRDVKPSNILLRTDQDAVVGDFGLIKAIEASHASRSLSTGWAGTSSYVAPELWEGKAPSAASDVYSLGCVLYKVLIGHGLVNAATQWGVEKQHRESVRLMNSSDRLSERVKLVLARALACDPTHRYASAGAFARALCAAVEAQEHPERWRDWLAREISWAERHAQPDRVVRLCEAYEHVQPGAPTIATKAEKARAALRPPAGPEKQPQRRPWLAGVVLVLVVVVALGWGVPQILGDAWPPWAPPPTATLTPTVMPLGSQDVAVIMPSLTVMDTPTATNTPKPRAGDTRVSPKDAAVMVYVPAGEFQMGSTEAEIQDVVENCISDKFKRDDCEGWYRDEQPMHTVALDAFWLDQTEVSVNQFHEFVTVTGYKTEAEQEGWGQAWTGEAWEKVEGADWQQPNGPDSQAKDKHPVVQVSWNDAVTYCTWAGKRLPTEAEWEYAARGPERQVYPWGNLFDCTRGNFDDETKLDSYMVPGGKGCDGYDQTAPVGSFPRGVSWVGALDMAGNVWEWVADRYGDYPAGQRENPTGPKTGEYRVIRGGGWNNLARFVRSANRDWYSPSGRNGNVGFRCAIAARQGP